MIVWLCLLVHVCAAPPEPAALPPQAEPAFRATLADLPPEAQGDGRATPQASALAEPDAASPLLVLYDPGGGLEAAGEPAVPAWRRYAVPARPAGGRPTLAIVIDDMGMNGVQSARALTLLAPVTLSWLPYAPNVARQAALGAAHGHETMVHMPMEALGLSDPGPDALRTWLPPDSNLTLLRQALDAIPGAVALNQHEGSVASLSIPLMDMVMDELRGRGMAFLDSLTIPHSVALGRARAADLPAVARDVFLDNDPTPAAIRARLTEAEAIARHYGHAVAIGHPHAATIGVLQAYLPMLEARGFVQWPISATIAAVRGAEPAQAEPVQAGSAQAGPERN